MSNLYLFARIAGTPVSLRTGEIEAVVRLKDLSPVPGALDYVAGLSALRSRVLTVIDASVLVTGCSREEADLRDAGRYAIICDMSGHSYGILVDGVDDIGTVDAPPLPLCGRVDPAWQPYVQGVIEWNSGDYFLISATDLLSLAA